LKGWFMFKSPERKIFFRGPVLRTL
jgi:hypothetical protein